MDRLTLCAVLTLLLPAKSLYAGDTCLADDQSGTCVRLSECSPLLDEIKKAGRPMPMYIRMKLSDRACGFESNEPLICCIPSTGNPTINTPDPGNGVTMNPLSRDKPPSDPDTHMRTGGPPDVQNHPNLHLLQTKNCGVSMDADRVLGGNRTMLFEMPWMVLLSYDSPRGRRLSCGGTLINERYVLTAAHCVTFLGNSLKFTGVVLGEWDVRKDPDCEQSEGKPVCAPSVRNVTAESVIAHTGYSPQSLVDDIALIRLSEPADFTLDSMKPVCLPVTPQLQNENLQGMGGVVAGWGATEDGMQSPVLLSVELPIIGNKECQDAFNGTPRIHDRQMCAGGVLDKDSCTGDSGGPLMYYGNVGSKGTRTVQRGIVSYGSKFCGNGRPGVYTRIAYFMDWILDNMTE